MSMYEREEKHEKVKKESKTATSRMTLASLEMKIANMIRARLSKPKRFKNSTSNGDYDYSYYYSSNHYYYYHYYYLFF